MQKELLTVREMAEFLSVSVSTGYRYLSRREFPFIQKPLRIRRNDLENWLNTGKVEASLSRCLLRKAMTTPVPIEYPNGGGNGGMARKAKSKGRLVFDNGAILIRQTKNKRERFYIEFYNAQNKRTREVVKNASNFTEAKAALDRRAQEEHDIKFGIIRRKEQITFNELADMYKTWTRTNKKSWKTDFGRLKGMQACFGRNLIELISSQDVERYKKMRVDEGVKHSTVNKSLQILSRIFSLAIEWDYLKHNPCRVVTKFSEEPFRRKRVLSKEEERRLYDAIVPDYLKSMVKIFLYSGLRRQELFKLTWDDADFRNRQIYVRETKTAKSRYIPINDTVCSELMKLYETRKTDDLVFVNLKSGKGFVCIRKAFQGACKRADVKNLTLHDLRRTFATRLLNAGTDIITVQHLLGHTSVTTTQIYTMTNQEQKRLAVSLLDSPNQPELARIWPTKQNERLPFFKQTHLISMN